MRRPSWLADRNHDRETVVRLPRNGSPMMPLNSPYGGARGELDQLINGLLRDARRAGYTEAIVTLRGLAGYCRLYGRHASAEMLAEAALELELARQRKENPLG